MRQTLDGSGDVLAATGYDPWGTPQQPLTTPFGFTGELHQQDRVQLRARWYDPGNGTFTSRDPFGGFPTQPYSLHPYQYAYSNPVNWSDPSGRVPQTFETDVRDLTDWLYRTMMHNLQDPRLRWIRTLNAIGDTSGGLVRFQCNTGVASLVLDPYGVKLTAQRVAFSDPLSKGIFFGAASGYVFAGTQFSALVKDHGPWDFKHLIEDRLGPGITLCASNGCRTDVDHGVPGNIHFGFVARAGDYYGWEVQAGAGIAEIFDPSHDPESPDFVPYEGAFGGIITPGGTSFNFGDDPDDHNDVAFGIHLYDTYGEGLTLPQFQQELQVWLPTLKHNVPSNQPVREDVQRAFPYRVDYFNPS